MVDKKAKERLEKIKKERNNFNKEYLITKAPKPIISNVKRKLMRDKFDLEKKNLV